MWSEEGILHLTMNAAGKTIWLGQADSGCSMDGSCATPQGRAGGAPRVQPWLWQICLGKGAPGNRRLLKVG